MVTIIVIQASLSKDSKTSIVTKEAVKKLEKKGVEVEVIDLREVSIPFCDGRKLEKYSKEVQEIYSKIEMANGYILSYPVYNYSFSGSLKNFIDIFSYAMDSKVTGIINNSASVRSWNHGAGELMKILAMHNNITTIQPIVHSSREDFDEKGLLENSRVLEKIDDMIERLLLSIEMEKKIIR